MAREPVTELTTEELSGNPSWLIQGPGWFKIVLPKLGHEVDEEGRRLGARPTKLTDAVATKICTGLRNGAHQGTAAEWAGIPAERMSKWMHATGEPYETFQEAVRHSQAFAEVRATVTVTSSKDAKDALLFLEKRFPKRWGKQAPVQQNILAVMDLGAMLDRIEKRRRDPQAPHDPRPPRVIDIQDAEIVPALPEAKPKREPVV